MTRMRMLLFGAAVVSSMTAGCAAKGPVKFQAIQVSGEKVAMPEGTRVNPAEWPNACRLLTKDEIKSMLPQAGVSSESKRVKFIGPGAPKSEAPAGQCVYLLSLPGTTTSYRSMIWVDIVAIGDTRPLATVADFSSTATVTDHGNSLGPQQCVTTRSPSSSQPNLYCRQGPLTFALSGSPLKKASIEGASTEAERDEIWYQKAVIPTAKAVAAKVSGP